MAGLIMCAMSPAAVGQAWPTRPILTISPFSAGNANDIVARIVLETVSRQFRASLTAKMEQSGKVIREAGIRAE